MSYSDPEPYLDQLKRAGVILAPGARKHVRDALQVCADDHYEMGKRIEIFARRDERQRVRREVVEEALTIVRKFSPYFVHTRWADDCANEVLSIGEKDHDG